MDQAKLSYFVARFGAYDPEALADLHARRADLAEEAVEALDRVLTETGLGSTLTAAPSQAPARTEKEEAQDVAQQTTASRALWRGGLSRSAAVIVAMACLAPVQNFLKSTQLGALWVGAIVALVFFAGYRLGDSITKEICANGDVRIEEKKKKLWVVLCSALLAFLVLYTISHALFVRANAA